jgi:zinc finger-containing ubiquitin peptidase 1
MEKNDQLDQQQQQALHSCEICGATGLSEQNLLEHTRKCHVENSPSGCPFCGLTGLTDNHLMIHVNTHLDYLTPDPDDSEMMSFIDDPSSIDSDSECRGISPLNDFTQNGRMTSSYASSSSSQNGKINGQLENGFNHKHPPRINYPTEHTTTNGTTTKHLNGGTMNNFCDTLTNGTTTTNTSINNYCNGGQGSPLRSQLGLNLKSVKPHNVTKPSPLQCPLCEYMSESAHVLEEHINRSHFDPMSPGVQNGELAASNNHQKLDTLTALQCPICVRVFTTTSDIELHINFEHRDILSPAKPDHNGDGGANGGCRNDDQKGSLCPVCGISLEKMKTQEMELHIEKHFTKSPHSLEMVGGPCPSEKKAQKLREQREFEMLRAQYGMDDQGNFRQQSATSMQRAVYAGEMSVADYYERQVGLRAAEQHGIDDGLSCTKSVAARVLSLSATSQGVVRTFVCSGVDHYASSYGDKGWGCGYRNLQMLLSSMLQVCELFISIEILNFQLNFPESIIQRSFACRLGFSFDAQHFTVATSRRSGLGPRI